MKLEKKAKYPQFYIIKIARNQIRYLEREADHRKKHLLTKWSKRMYPSKY